MDLRTLVDRIADALGPDVTPARVEAVASSVLSLMDSASERPPAADAPGERVIISAFGHDQPGILAGIASALHETGTNILDVSQKILQGYFTLMMIADVSAAHTSVPALKERLHQAGERLNVRILVQHEDLFNAMHRP